MIVEEPTEEETFEILKGLRPYYERHHKVKIQDDALKAAVEMSIRYISDRFLPDKAIDVIDEAASKVQLQGFQTAPELEEVQRQIQELIQEKEEAVKAGDLGKAGEIQKQQKELEASFEKRKEKAQKAARRKQLLVDEKTVADIVSQWTKIPVQKLTEGESKRLARLEKELHKRVIGQEEAVAAAVSYTHLTLPTN